MAFKLTKKLPPVAWPVKLPEPVDGGKVNIHEVSVTFRQLFDHEIEAAYKGKSKKAFLKDVIVNWEGFLDEDGKAVPFSEEVLEQILSISWARDAMFEAHTAMTLGIAEKN